MNPKRIHVCGTSGSGKSTLARRLADLIGGDYIELDSLWHRENWTTVPVDVFQRDVAVRIARERWAIDGNYKKVREIIWERADLIVWLDYPLPIIFGRLTRRTFGRAFRREVLWHGNRENLWRHLFVPKDSLFWWVLTTYKRRRRELAEFKSDPRYERLEFRVFRHPRETEEWVESLTRRLVG